MSEARVEIPEDEILFAGETIWLTYQVTSWLWSQSAEIAIIESHIEERKDFMLVGNTLPDENGYIEFEIRVIDPQADEPEIQQAGVLTVAIVSGVILTAILWTASLLYVKAEKSYKAKTKYAETIKGSPSLIAKDVITSPGGQIAAGAIGIAVLVAIAGKYFNFKLR